MTLTQLRTFLAVAETGSVKAAARRLVVTESAVSASLVALQRSLGLRLIRPAGRGLALTGAGEVYAAQVRRALGLLESARTAAAGEADPETGELRIAAVTPAAEQLLPRLLHGFLQAHPRVRISPEIGNRERVHALLDHHETDLVIGGRPPGNRTTLAVRPNELVVVTAPGATGRRWLLREKGSGTRAATEALLDGLGLDPPTMTLGSNAAIREAVVAGLGVSLMSRDAVERELAAGALVVRETPGTPLRRDWHLVAQPGRLPATAALFVRHLLGTGAFLPP